MYNYLVNATKNRLILELKDVFSKHPIYKTLEIYNRFPYSERIQEGVIVKNSSASRVPLSADNFQGTVQSYVTFAKHSNFPGLSIEWVREDESHLSSWIYKEDFSYQFTQSNTIISLNTMPIRGRKDLSPADSIKDVEIFVNNAKVIPYKVGGVFNQITLESPPPVNSKVEVSYWVRNLVPSGIYQVEIVDGNPGICDPKITKFAFMVDPLLDKEQILFQKTNGHETTARLDFYPIYPNSLRIKENNIIMDPNTEYVVDERSGIITFLINPLHNARIEATYRVKGISSGPFDIPNLNYAYNTAIPGVVIAFGKGLNIGDKHFVVVNKNRELTSLEYSGKWEMALSLDVYAKDSFKVEEIIDITTSWLHVYRKSQLDAEGIALVDVSFSGESEQVFDDATGDLYYMGSVDYNFLTEWIMHQPLLLTIEGYEAFTSYISQAEPFFPDRNKHFEMIR